ncbi:MAG: DUF927 domain-containing protein [Eubacteriales bacterium]|jgi:hypothetical protein
MSDLPATNEFTYTYEDFMSGIEPYEFIYGIKNLFIQGQTIERLALHAQNVGVKGFKGLYRKYLAEVKGDKTAASVMNETEFSGQPLTLNCGDWNCTDYGVAGVDLKYGGDVLACAHPIMPVEILRNIDTGIEKVNIAFSKGDTWRNIITEKKTISSNQSIVELSNSGVSVTSETAKYLVRYLNDIENLNYTLLPKRKCVSRLGWIRNSGFAPYVDELIFDGDANYKAFFESVTQKGDYNEWLKLAKILRSSNNMPARIILASSFASALVEPTMTLPFFVHLWGGTESGKTVGLMLGASVWANPTIGEYVHTFNATLVGQERSASFVNSLPLIMDELQIVKGNRDFDKIIYMLSEGAGRARGNKTGGVDRVPRWNNVIMTSGEMPLTNTRSGAGAINRIIEIECKEKIFNDPKWVVDVVKENYGYAGKEFVEVISKANIYGYLQTAHKKNLEKLMQFDGLEKQASAMALILTADMIATQYIFQDENCLQVEDLAGYMKSKDDVNASLRAYHFLLQWIAQNKYKFVSEFDPNATITDVYGVIAQDEQAYIIRSKFDDVLSEAGFNSVATLSWLRDNNLIETRDRGYTKTKRINGIAVECVILSLGDSEEC